MTPDDRAGPEHPDPHDHADDGGEVHHPARDVAPAHDQFAVRRLRDDQLIIALLTGVTYAQAAESAGCSEVTVRRRLADPAFVERLEAERRDLFDKAAARLLSAIPIAQATLIRIAEDRAAPATAQVNAARSILQHAREYLHDATVESRLAAIEVALQRGVIR